MTTSNFSAVIATPIREYLESTMRRHEADEIADMLTGRIEKLLLFHGYSIVSHAEIREMIGPSREVDNCPKCNETVALGAERLRHA